ncbi:MAG TPA: SDR family NAD(P)-dependent oxidoreductase [Acidimicrobiia bacterium]|nr:SDR family NAD(P)-dependent oxidoreductase [Acidimicrobiia bacterium]
MAYRGNVALVTGAGSGMGQLMARRLAAQGANVAAVDIDERGLAATSMRAPTITAYPCDVTDAEAVSLVVKRVEDDIGPIDRVVNAAGIAPAGAMLEQSAETILRVMAVNYGGTVNVTKAALPGMVERGRGDVINFASLAGWVPVPNLGAYNASKFAVVAFSEVLAFECADSGVRFVCVCPPAVDTPMLDQFAGVKLFQYAKSISPAAVLDAIEAGIEDGDLFVFPGRGSRFVWRLRRFAPQRVWSNLGRIERRA